LPATLATAPLAPGSKTEPVLQALGIRYYVMRDPADAPELTSAPRCWLKIPWPVALLLTKEVLGWRAVLKSL
jgi:hypothetical protein